MIWETIVLMTITDLLILSVSSASLWLFFKHRASLIQSGTLPGSSLIIVGLIGVGLFYFADLLTMWALPLVTGRATAMAAMENLHLYSWMVMLFVTVSIFIGVFITFRRLFLMIDNVKKSEAELKSEVSIRQETEKALRSIVEGTSSVTGAEFFNSLVQKLSKALRADVALIGKLTNENPGKVTTIAVSNDGKIVDNFEYRLEGTPCENVIKKQHCSYPRGVQQLFPHACRVAELGIESYFGTSLIDSTGETLGLMVVLNRRPLRNVELTESMLRIFAGRASAEMERVQAEQALRKSEQRYQTLTALSPVGIFHTDSNGDCLYVNERCAEMTGITSENSRGKGWAQALHPEDRDRVLTEWSDAARAKRSFSSEYRFRHPGGRVTWVYGQAEVEIEDGAVAGYVGTITDITQHKRAEEEIRRHHERQAALYDANVATTSTLDLKSILGLLLEKIDLFFSSAVAATVRLLNKESDLLEPLACRNLVEDAWKAKKMKPGHGLAYAVFKAKSPVMVGNFRTDHRTQDPGFFHKQNLVSYLGVPLIVKGEVLGVLGLFTKEEHQFSKEEIEFLSTLASQASIAIHNSQLYEQTKKQGDENSELLEQVKQKTVQLEETNQQISALYSVATAVNQSLDIQPVLRSVMYKVLDIFSFDAGWIRLLSEDGKEMRFVAQEGTEIFSTFGKPIPLSRECLMTTVLKTGKPFFFEDVQTDSEYHRLTCTKEPLKRGFRGSFTIPIRVKDKILGGMSFLSKKPHRFSPNDVELIHSIADHVGIAVENARLYQEARRREEIQGLLKEFSQDIIPLDIDSLLKKLTDKVREMLKVDVADVRVFEENGWHRKGLSGTGAELLVSEVKSRARTNWIVKHRRVLMIPDITEIKLRESGESRDTSWLLDRGSPIRKLGLRGYLGVPLFSRERKVLGVLRALSYEPREFNQEEIDLLQQLANGVAIALENARLFEESQAKTKELSALYSVATVVNQSLDIEFVLRSVMHKVQEIFAFDVARIRLLREDGKEWYVLAEEGIEQLSLLREDSLAYGINATVLQTGKPIFFEDIQNDPEYKRISISKDALKTEFRSSFRIPVRVKDKVRGVMIFLSKRPHRFFPNEIELIHSIADHVGIAVENAQLYEQTKMQAVELARSIGETEAAKQELEIDIAERKRVGEELRSSREQFRDLAGHLQSVREEERTQMAREVHDELGQSLTALKMDLSWLRKKLPKGQAALLEKI
ncbi:MAG: GAF domain-containing protein, partial [Candidatus Binatia bacterium]